MKKYLELLFCIPKSIYFNLKYLPFNSAVMLPILVRRIALKQMRGNVIIEGKIKTGMIRMGFGDVAIFGRNHSRGIWHVSGTVIFNGITRLDHGTSISVGEYGILSLGKNFKITANTSIICKKRIDFGDNCLLSWDILIMDSDFHKILNNNGEITNLDETIKIGNKVWIGCRSTILKGTVIADETIIGACSMICNTYADVNTVIGGNPARIIKSGFHWDY